MTDDVLAAVGGRQAPTDALAFDDFYRASAARLVGALFVLTGNLQEAEDVVQEAFVRAADRWERVRAFDRPEAWVRLVALKPCLSWMVMVCGMILVS